MYFYLYLCLCLCLCLYLYLYFLRHCLPHIIFRILMSSPFQKCITSYRCLRFSLYLSLSLYLSVYLSVCLSLYLYFRPNLDSWHRQLSENIRFEGYLRPYCSVTAHLWTQEKLLRAGGRTGGRTGGREKSKVLQKVLADLKFTFDLKSFLCSFDCLDLVSSFSSCLALFSSLSPSSLSSIRSPSPWYGQWINRNKFKNRESEFFD